MEGKKIQEVDTSFTTIKCQDQFDILIAWELIHAQALTTKSWVYLTMSQRQKVT